MHTSLLSEEEGLKDIDKGAKTELEGAPDLDSAFDAELGVDKAEAPVEAPEAPADLGTDLEAGPDKEYNPKLNQVNKPGGSGYTLSNVADQLDGIVNNWFQFAVDLPPDAKEKFLALGERLSEISDIVKEEFSNAKV